MSQSQDRPLTEESLYEWVTCLPISPSGQIVWRSLGDVFSFARMLSLAGMIEPSETVLHCTLRILAGIQLGLDPLRSMAQLSRYGRTIRPNLSYAMARLYELHPEAHLEVRWYVDDEVLDDEAARPRLRRGQKAHVSACLQKTPRHSWEWESYSLAEAEAEGLLDGPGNSWWVVNTAHAMQQRAIAWLLRRTLAGAFELRDDDRPTRLPGVVVESTPGVENHAAMPVLSRNEVKVAGVAQWKEEPPTGRKGRRRAPDKPQPKLEVPQEVAERAVADLEVNQSIRGEPRGEMAALDLANAEAHKDEPEDLMERLAELEDLDEDPFAGASRA